MKIENNINKNLIKIKYKRFPIFFENWIRNNKHKSFHFHEINEDKGIGYYNIIDAGYLYSINDCELMGLMVMFLKQKTFLPYVFEAYDTLDEEINLFDFLNEEIKRICNSINEGNNNVE